MLLAIYTFFFVFVETTETSVSRSIPSENDWPRELGDDRFVDEVWCESPAATWPILCLGGLRLADQKMDGNV